MRAAIPADVRVSPDGSTVAFVERFIDAQHRTRSYIWLLTVANGKSKRLSKRTRQLTQDGFGNREITLVLLGEREVGHLHFTSRTGHCARMLTL